MISGSIGMLASASLAGSSLGLYEPIHGSAPDIAGQGVANPLATILSAAMMLRYSFDEAEAATRLRLRWMRRCAGAHAGYQGGGPARSYPTAEIGRIWWQV